ncbi:hypothetical protein CC1G_08348 [Coprinopsis cinerea okayama7|uniref:Restriction of telomere capping protein 4 n=1 Tax=Coprinopsis cinerea (strain Okayama-7 / 130 / ATCC MYA-4618 / FGSC 9003) TaxID=240176 RepID=A8NA92_COPC7|nr:hypothetical protein CC1G_08348 [Coprinopsis cinerea okayama7\|eukprot:XP_001831744.2 hypothetical protein CC1G_08348 [Coprinopsis cinerea okayama7\
MNARFRDRGTTIWTDSSVRRPTRSGSSSQPSGKSRTACFDEYGSGFSSQQAKKSQSTYSKKSTTRKRPHIQDREHDFDSSSSDDPLDSLSEASPSKSKEKKGFIDDDGQKHEYHPLFKPKDDVFKNLKFKKTGSGASGSKSTAGDDKPRQFDSKGKNADAGLSPTTRTKEDVDLYDEPPKGPPTRSRPAPRPRLVAKTTTDKPSLPSRKAAPVKRAGSNSRLANKYCVISSDDENEVPEQTPKQTKTRPRKQPQDFPVSPPTSQPVSSGSSRREKAKPAPFPMMTDTAKPSLSPGKGKKKAVVQPFPLEVPSRQDKTFLVPKKGKEQESLFTDDEDGGPLPQPFPLSTQFLNGTPSPTRRKRHSRSGVSDDDDTTPRKKVRDSIGMLNLSDFGEGNSMFLSSSVDPSTLCPYCDSPLPPSPSPMLLKLLETAKKKSYPDARPSNPLGRKAPFTQYIAVCQRHRFEIRILPEAEKKRWPKSIDWKKLGPRIQKMKRELQEIIDDDGDVIEVVDEDGSDSDNLGSGPRSKSHFWREVMSVVKEKGVRAAAGVKDQFLNFEKTQPGYYGELGSVIIHQTLYDMFPPSSFDLDSISPLSPEEFTQKILVPEVGLRLIMEDRNLHGPAGEKSALQILRESSAYGVAMFPADAGDEGVETSRAKKQRDGVEAGELIVMERARKRRQEIEEEEEREKAEEERREREKREAEAGVPRPRPRPRPLKASSSAMSITTDPEEYSFVPRASRKRSSRYDTDVGRYSRDETDTSGASESSDADAEPPGEESPTSPTVSEIDVTTPSGLRNPAGAKPTPVRLPVSDSAEESDSRSKKKRQPKRVTSRSSKRYSDESDMDVSSCDEDFQVLVSTVKTPKAKASKMGQSRVSQSREMSIELIEDKTPKPKRRVTSVAPDPVASSTAYDTDVKMPPLERARARRLQREASSSSKNTGKEKAPARRSSDDSWVVGTMANNGFRTLTDSSDPADADWLLRDVSSSREISPTLSD